MRWSKTITLVGAHAEGEIGQVITGGVVSVPGATMVEKMVHLNSVDDSLRRFVLFEPRGAAQMSINLLLPPVRPEAQAGFIVMQPDGCHAMSGSNAMCVATVLLELGILPMTEPVTEVMLDTPAGLVKAVAACRDGKVEKTAIDMPASFVEHLDHPLTLDDGTRLAVDVAYGGAYYALVDSDALGIEIRPAEARRLVELARRIKSAAVAQIKVRHPDIPAMDRIEYVMFVSRYDAVRREMRGGTVIHPGRMDRSPCGTGTSARLAVLHARGMIAAGETATQYSIIGSRFEATIVGITKVGGRPAILPRIAGRAWIYAMQQVGVDPTDPYPLGYTMPDTWGPEAADPA